MGKANNTAPDHRHLAFSNTKLAVHFYKQRPSIAGDIGAEFDESGNKNDDVYRMCAVVAQAAAASTTSITTETTPKDYGMLMLQYRENNNLNHPSNGQLQAYIEALKNDTNTTSLHGSSTMHPSQFCPNRAQRVQKQFREQCERRWRQLKRWPALPSVKGGRDIVDPTQDDVQEQLERLEKERLQKLQDSVQLDPADLERYWKLKQLEDEMVKVHQRRRPKLSLKWGKPSQERRQVAVEQRKRKRTSRFEPKMGKSSSESTGSLDVRESLLRRSEEITARNAATKERRTSSSGGATTTTGGVPNTAGSAEITRPSADAHSVHSAHAQEKEEKEEQVTGNSTAPAEDGARPPSPATTPTAQAQAPAAQGLPQTPPPNTPSPTVAVEQTVTTITDWMRPEMSDEHNPNVSCALFWTEAEVATWLDKTIGLGIYAHAFHVNGITGSKLINVKASSLPTMGIKNWSHIKRITAGLRELLKIQKIRLPVSIADHPADPMQLYLEIKSRDGFLGDQLTYERFLNHLPKLQFAPELSLKLQRK